MPENRLAAETSPYLLQHKDNPVHWRPWGREALDEARRTGKPVLLSVGYAACHWCHVMAHESFEDEETAAVMNELFVNVKVDREERPDIDAIYMTALHSLGEQGGWPLTMFLTPDGEPFWGGTYFPKEPKFGRPGFKQVLSEIARIYREEPDKIAGNAAALKAHLEPKPGVIAQGHITEPLLADAARRVAGLVDPEHGGLKGAPKFPQSPFFAFLWRAGIRYGLDPARAAVVHTLTHICQGGIYDHLGGGFARYSVDARWLVPHFEKMLYDNAQLVELLTEAWKETKTPLFAARVAETVGWLLREMTTESGGFASSLDADSEGEEGKFYVWTAEEIDGALGKKDAAFFCKVYGVTPDGNFEGRTILNRLRSLELLGGKDEARLAKLRVRLLALRDERVRPGFDDKVLADWNGLMIAALANAATAFGKPDWLKAAQAAYAFVKDGMSVDGRLMHSWREGKTSAPATAADYAAMTGAALALHAATGGDERIADAEGWVAVLDRHYWSAELSGYHMTADDTDDVLVRPFSGLDDATPNPNGLMLANLSALAALTGKEAYRIRAETMLTGFTGEIAQNLYAHTSLLSGALALLAPVQIVVVAPKGRKQAAALLKVLTEVSLPGAVVQAIASPRDLPENSPAAGKTAKGGKPTAYVCAGPVCAAPAATAKAFKSTLEEWRQTKLA